MFDNSFVFLTYVFVVKSSLIEVEKGKDKLIRKKKRKKFENKTITNNLINEYKDLIEISDKNINNNQDDNDEDEDDTTPNNDKNEYLMIKNKNNKE